MQHRHAILRRAKFQSTLPTRGSDRSRSASMSSGRRISIHAPHEGERRADNERCYKGLQFQSTLPTRGSDKCQRGLSNRPRYFNPRSPRGGATEYFGDGAPVVGISIHAPHEGERRVGNIINIMDILFQSTLPTRGSDQNFPIPLTAWTKFQSTLPTRGSDILSMHMRLLSARFQSTLPTRGSDW